MALSGKYELVRDEGQYEHLIANGFPEDRAKSFLEGGKTLEISVNGDDISIARGSGRVQNLKLNQETTEAGPDGKVFKNTAKLDGENLVHVTSSDRGDWKRILSISGDELTVTSVSTKAGAPDGKRIYKRV